MLSLTASRKEKPLLGEVDGGDWSGGLGEAIQKG